MTLTQATCGGGSRHRRRAAKKEAQKAQETKETGAGRTTRGRRNCCRTTSGEDAEEKKRFNNTEPWLRDLAQSQDKLYQRPNVTAKKHVKYFVTHFVLSKTVGQGIKVFVANAKSVWSPLIAATLRMPPIPCAHL